MAKKLSKREKWAQNTGFGKDQYKDRKKLPAKNSPFLAKVNEGIKNRPKGVSKKEWRSSREQEETQRQAKIAQQRTQQKTQNNSQRYLADKTSGVPSNRNFNLSPEQQAEADKVLAQIKQQSVSQAGQTARNMMGVGQVVPGFTPPKQSTPVQGPVQGAYQGPQQQVPQPVQPKPKRNFFEKVSDVARNMSFGAGNQISDLTEMTDYWMGGRKEIGKRTDDYVATQNAIGQQMRNPNLTREQRQAMLEGAQKVEKPKSQYEFAGKSNKQIAGQAVGTVADVLTFGRGAVLFKGALQKAGVTSAKEFAKYVATKEGAKTVAKFLGKESAAGAVQFGLGGAGEAMQQNKSGQEITQNAWKRGKTGAWMQPAFSAGSLGLGHYAGKVMERLKGRTDDVANLTTRKISTNATDDMADETTRFLDSKKPKTDPLIQEAKKYKSAEDILYRGEGKQGPRVSAEKNFGDGIYLTNKESYAAKYGDVKQYKLSPKAKVLEVGRSTSDDGVDMLYDLENGMPLESGAGKHFVEDPTQLSKYAKKNGYDAVKIIGDDGTHETVVVNKSQLTDIWNKANQKVSQQTDEVVKAIDAPQTQIKNTKIPALINEQEGGKIKKRGFFETVKESLTPRERELAKTLEKEGFYRVRNTKELAQKAQNFVKDYPHLAKEVAMKSSIDDVSGSVAMEFLKKKRLEGAFDEEFDEVLRVVSKKFTQSGRFSQIASIWDKTTPEGMLRFAQRQVDKYNVEAGKSLVITPQMQNRLAEKTLVASKIADEYQRMVAYSDVMGDIAKMFPSSGWRKTSTVQTMAQLLNPKTWVRNIGGNTIMGGAEIGAQTIGTPIDKALSVVTKKREVGLPSLSSLWGGAKKGAKQAYLEGKLGIDLSGIETSMELSNVPTFRDGILGKLEKGMNISLKVPDRIAYQATFDDVINQLVKTNKAAKVEPWMIEKAHQEGLYRTFQDDTVLSATFQALKKTLNVLSPESITKIKEGRGLESLLKNEFGLGNFFLKYPKTPANLLNRGLAYTPAGFIKTVFHASRPLFGKQFNQREFVMSFSRALEGTVGLVGMGAAMHRLGIITEEPSKDRDVRAEEKKTGLGGYKINASALKRFVMSGLDAEQAKLQDGDMLVSYDWAQPLALSLAVGANIDANASKKSKYLVDKSTFDVAIESAAEGANTIVEQPMMRGVQEFFGGKDAGAAGAAVLRSSASSFMPTATSQVNQAFDNTTRETYDPNIFRESYNLAAAKVPGLAQMLPPKIGTDGNVVERYQNGTNSLLNVFLNPAYVTKFEASPESKMVLDVYRNTGTAESLPRMVDKEVDIKNGDGLRKMKLSTEQYRGYQSFVGKETQRHFADLAQAEWFKKLPDDEKSTYLKNVMTDIDKNAKAELFGHQVKHKTSDELEKEIVKDGKFYKLEEMEGKGIDNKYYAELNKLNKDELSEYKSWLGKRKSEERGMSQEQADLKEYKGALSGSMTEKYLQMDKLKDPSKAGSMDKYKKFQVLYAEELYAKIKSGDYTEQELRIASYDKDIRKKIEQIRDKNKLTNEEYELKHSYDVKDYTRSEEVWRRGQTMNADDRKKYYQNLIDKGIITKEIYKQIQELNNKRK